MLVDKKGTNMICELCGKDSKQTKTVFIEGTQLKVCKECEKFGETSGGSGPAKKGEAPNRAIVSERLQARERRMRTKDVYQEETTTDLAPDYPQKIRDARMAHEWKQEDLAARLNERASVVAKLESGTIRPNDDLIKKLERTLGVKLMEKVTVVKPEAGHGASKGLTLGDLMPREKK